MMEYQRRYTATTWPIKRWPNFSYDEMKCSHCGECLLDPSLMDKLQFMRIELGFPLAVTSGYRCNEHPNEVNKESGGGAHTFGVAADIAVYGQRAFDVLSFAIASGFTGIGVSQKSGGDPKLKFFHLDLANGGLDPKFKHIRKGVWSY